MSNLLWLIIVILVVAWIAGVSLKFAAGGLLHILLVIAIILVIFNLISGRRRL